MDRDISKVWITNGSVLGFVTVAETEAILKCLLLLATIIYTTLKCWRLFRQKSNDDTIQIKKDKNL